MDSKRRVIIISYRHRDYKIAWFPPTNDHLLRETIKETIGLCPDSSFVLKDEQDPSMIVAITTNLPHLSRFLVEERINNHQNNDHIGGGNTIIHDVAGYKDTKDKDKDLGSSSSSSSSNSASVSATTAFRGELLKFERINAHLANERTWLAWIRTALSTMSCAFAFLSLSTSGIFKRVVYGLGCLFCLAVMFVYLTGWSRYRRVKLILGLSFNQMYVQYLLVKGYWFFCFGVHSLYLLLIVLFGFVCVFVDDDRKNHFDRLGISWVSYVLGVLFASTCFLYWVGVAIDLS